MTNPTHYRLALAQTSTGLEAMWIFPEPGGASTRFPLVHGLTAEVLEEHRWYLEDYLVFPGPGDHARARAFEQRLAQFGEALYRALFVDGRDILGTLVAAPSPRLLTLSSNDRDALALPWELLRDGRGPVVFRDVVIRRQLAAAVPTKPAPVPGLPLRILLVIARPTDAPALDARSSAGLMLDALQTLGGHVRVDLCDPPTLAELERRLGDAADRGERYHIVHFDGHGHYEQDRGVGSLYFEKLDFTKDPVSGQALGDLLARLDVPLVLLEACHTADLSGRLVFGAVAPALLKSGVGSVLAFSHGVYPRASCILVERFYTSLTRSKSIGAALNDGRLALQSDRVRDTTRKGDLELHDWHITQLYQAGPDQVLVPAGATFVAEGTEPLQRGLPPGKDFGPEPMYGFHGRARELLALHRKLRKHHAVVVPGMGGMGKTSLAREAAHWWHRIGLRPDGAAFFSFASRQGADRAVQAFVQYVEGDGFVQGSPEALWARAVAHFHTRAVLWVWDNFESTLPQFQEGRDAGTALFDDEERARLRKLFGELTSGKPAGWLVVTCRPDETGLLGIAEMAIEGLNKSDALEMAREVLARKDIKVGSEGYEREAIEALLAAVHWHPLSIELVMAHIKTVRPGEAVKELRKLVTEAVQGAGDEKNRSLMASIKWSTDRLSEEARGVLPYLAWFDGGAFEVMIEAFSTVGPEVWGRVREELLATALVRAEDVASVVDKPYLGFHPTLPYAAEPEAAGNEAEARKRFVMVYHKLTAAVNKAFQGTKPANGMETMTREYGNLRRAVVLAFAQGEFDVGVRLADTIRIYLTMAGRVGDQAIFAAWVQKHVTEASGPARWAVDREHASGLSSAGRMQDAVDLLRRQLEAIEKAGGDMQQKALCAQYLGRIHVDKGQHLDALGPLEQAIRGFEAVGDQANLVAALGDQANAFRGLGRFPEARANAERVVAIARIQGNARNEAVGLAQIGASLMEQHHFCDAERCYRDALKAACLVGDMGLQGLILQHIGVLSGRQGNNAHAVTCYKDAFTRFQAAEDQASEMQTAGLLGTAEAKRGQYDAARAWYADAERLARELGYEDQLAGIAHNIGVLLQEQALALPAEAKEERMRLLREAAASVAKALAIHRKRGDDMYTAVSVGQLGVIHLFLGAFDEAQIHAQEALAIRKRLDLPDVWKDYSSLEDIAVARNRPEEAATWRAKKEAKLAELQRLARGDGPPVSSPPASGDPCPCGSGQPFRACHGADDAS